MARRLVKFLSVFMMVISSVTSFAFIEVKGRNFTDSGTDYRFVGANFWYGANLAVIDRARLERELDHLARLGVKNLRIMAGTEGPDTEPWRITPSLQVAPGVYNETVFAGLDILLFEMAKRGMHAVMCLSNFWHWSGGLSQYVAWVNRDKIPYPPPEPAGDWTKFRAYSQGFYSNRAARDLYLNHIKTVVLRINHLTGLPYRNDPTIMTWELANEPDPGESVSDFLSWVSESAKLIKQLDSHHLVISGSEGESSKHVLSIKEIDYHTIHIWAENAGFYNPFLPEKTFDSALVRARSDLTIATHMTNTLNKPLVLAEFGLARDFRSMDPSSPATYRAQYFRVLLQDVYKSVQEGESLRGIAFWAWGGEGRARTPGGFWRERDSLIGDPPHEEQGWYSVYHMDRAVLDIIYEYAKKIGSTP